MHDSDQPDRSNGWNATPIAELRNSQVGIDTIQAWANTLPAGTSILDLGCGPGTPRSKVLIDAGFEVYAVDAAPIMAAAYQDYFPAARVVCEPAEESNYFGRTFDAVMSWGLMFLLTAETQRNVVHRVAKVLKPGGRFLFTAPTQILTWADASTGLESVSLGFDEYTSILRDAGFELIAEYTDDGENHYYDSLKSV
jgi:SAM-dependent methyltransferase